VTTATAAITRDKDGEQEALQSFSTSVAREVRTGVPQHKHMVRINKGSIKIHGAPYRSSSNINAITLHKTFTIRKAREQSTRPREQCSEEEPVPTCEKGPVRKVKVEHRC
jgi:hypothetical protein